MRVEVTAGRVAFWIYCSAVIMVMAATYMGVVPKWVYITMLTMLHVIIFYRIGTRIYNLYQKRKTK